MSWPPAASPTRRSKWANQGFPKNPRRRDEPTTGLDPRNRQLLWEVIRQLVSGGTTLLLTTQYLEEADHLAHDIVVVDHGHVIARGTSDQLKARTGGERVEVVVHEREHITTAGEVLTGFGKGELTVEEHTRKLTVPVGNEYLCFSARAMASPASWNSAVSSGSLSLPSKASPY